MFVYSLAGLQVDGGQMPDIELPDNETTARTGVYQLLARLVSYPDSETYETAVSGESGRHLAEAGRLLPFSQSFDSPAIDGATSLADFRAEYLRLFEVGNGSSPPAPIYGGMYDAQRMQRLEEVVRFYEYFGLSTSAEDPRPADHLATELEFLKYLTYKEAVSSSARLQVSYRRAQHDFLDRQITSWVPRLEDRARAADAGPYWTWVTSIVNSFVEADSKYVSGVLAA